MKLSAPFPWIVGYLCLLPSTGAVSACQNPLGMENGAINDDQISASSTWDPRSPLVSPFYAHLARLNSDRAWIPDSNDDTPPYIQVDFQHQVHVVAIKTQGYIGGVANKSYYTRTYTITSSVEGGPWTSEVLSGNTDSVGTVEQEFLSQVNLRYLRIYPKTDTCVNGCALRFELYGCEVLPTTTSSVRPTSTISSTPTEDPQTEGGSTVTQSTTINRVITNKVTDADEATSSTAFNNLTTSPLSATGISIGSYITELSTELNNEVTTAEVTTFLPSTTSDSLVITTPSSTSTDAAPKMENTALTRKGSSAGPVAGAVIVVLVITIMLAGLALWLFRKRKRPKSGIEGGLQYDGPYELTVEGKPIGSIPVQPVTSQPDTYEGIVYDSKAEHKNDVQNKYDENVYAYADVNEKDLNKDRGAEGLVLIYAQSQYGGRPPLDTSSKEHHPQGKPKHRGNDTKDINDVSQDNEYAYAYSADVKGTSPNDESNAEGWVDNSIYATGNGEGDQSQLNAGKEIKDEGWEDNSIYAIADDEENGRGKNQDEDEGWEDNSIYAEGKE